MYLYRRLQSFNLIGKPADSFYQPPEHWKWDGMAPKCCTYMNKCELNTNEGVCNIREIAEILHGWNSTILCQCHHWVWYVSLHRNVYVYVILVHKFENNWKYITGFLHVDWRVEGISNFCRNQNVNGILKLATMA